MDADYVYQIVTTITTLLFGGTSLVSVINNRELKRKMAAEADQSEANSQKIVIIGLQEEVGRLQQRLVDMDERYIALETKYYNLHETITRIKEAEQQRRSGTLLGKTFKPIKQKK